MPFITLNKTDLMTKLLRFSVLIITLLGSFSVLSDETELPIVANESVKFVELHDLITQYRPLKEGSVDITLFKKLQTQGVVQEMPSARKSKYINGLVQRFGNGAVAPITHGFLIATEQGEVINIYLMPELIEMVQRDLKTGDEVKLSVFHAYTSDYGPGLLAYAYEQQAPPSLKERFLNWWQQSFEQPQLSAEQRSVQG